MTDGAKELLKKLRDYSNDNPQNYPIDPDKLPFAVDRKLCDQLKAAGLITDELDIIGSIYLL